MNTNDRITIGKSTLQEAEINISGYKHVAVMLIVAAIALKNCQIKLLNVPIIEDVKILSKIINHLGGVIQLADNELLINTNSLTNHIVPIEESQLIHGAIYLLPVLLGKLGKVEIGNCGGCPIGEQTFLGKRPTDHMLAVLEKFGAEFEKKEGKIIGKTKGFNCCTIDIMDFSERNDILTGPLVSGATKTAILASLFVKDGITQILNPYPKSDVTELLKFIKEVGFKVNYDKNLIEISKVKIKNQITFSVMSDISEIMTYITFAIYHNIPITLKNISTPSVKLGLKTELEYLQKMGIKNIEFSENIIKVSPTQKIDAIDIDVTSISIYSDHQPFFALLLSLASSNSLITEYVWKSRFDYATELEKIGLRFTQDKNTLRIFPGSPNRINQTLEAKDLRAAAVLTIAAAKIPGKTYIHGINHISRGYSNFITNLNALGINIHD